MRHRRIALALITALMGFIAGQQTALAIGQLPPPPVHQTLTQKPPAHVPQTHGKVDPHAAAVADAEEQEVNAAQAEADELVEEDVEVDKHGNPVNGMEVALVEEHALLGQGLTFELGTIYTHFDRRHLLLDGFLVLDALFLGDIAISKIESDTLTIYLLGRYSFTQIAQFEVYVPYTYRRSSYHKSGQEGDSTILQSTTQSQGKRIGDVSASVYVKAHPETIWWPDIVIYVQAKSDTGKKPYGIKEKLIGNESDNFRVPKSMPTGSGLWAATIGTSFVKTFDPVVLFANLGFTYNFKRSFSDLSSNVDQKIPGTVDLGNVYLVGFGVALAMNERIAMNLSFSEAFSEKTRIKNKGSGVGFQEIKDSEGNSATLNVGGTFALNERFSIVAAVGDGLTPDAPGVSVTVKVVGYVT